MDLTDRMDSSVTPPTSTSSTRHSHHDGNHRDDSCRRALGSTSPARHFPLATSAGPGNAPGERTSIPAWDRLVTMAMRMKWDLPGAPSARMVGALGVRTGDF